MNDSSKYWPKIIFSFFLQESLLFCSFPDLFSSKEANRAQTVQISPCDTEIGNLVSCLQTSLVVQLK